MMVTPLLLLALQCVFGTASISSNFTSFFNANPLHNWAILVAGSDGWFNYRHQADVCHAYHLLRDRGIPAKNIITMMVDDIANNTNNPFPGKIFNDYQHKDVYHDTVADYKGKEVDPDILVRVLLGDAKLKSKGKKVLESGPKDNVFLYFTDHGASGLIAFPESELHARRLNNTITQLHKKKGYNKFVLYIEACYSGSMFENILSSKINAYAMTAANSHQSSWATFCDDPVINTCLADEFSYNWMKDTETHQIHNLTLSQQYKHVAHRTKKSNVQRYGDLEMGSMTVDKFQSHERRHIDPAQDLNTNEAGIPADRVHLMASIRGVLKAKTEDGYEFAKRRLYRLLQLGTLVKNTMEDIVLYTRKTAKPVTKNVSKDEELMCFETVFEAFKLKCFTIQQVPEVAHHTIHLANLCKEGYDAKMVTEAVREMCM